MDSVGSMGGVSLVSWSDSRSPERQLRRLSGTVSTRKSLTFTERAIVATLLANLAERPTEMWKSSNLV